VVRPPADLLKKYKTFERDRVLECMDAYGDIVADSAAALTNKLLQFANGAIYDMDGGVHEIHDLKLEALEELVEQAGGDPVLILYAYQHDEARISSRIPCRKLDTDQDIRDWNAGRIPVAIAHPASIGHGLNLQYGGHILIWFGLTWSLELYQQANARLYRQGQEKPVIIHHLVAKGTMDEKVMKALKNKAAGQDALLEAVKAEVRKIFSENKLGGASNEFIA
jgi:hypothetical protein